jgi:hypothetical protein
MTNFTEREPWLAAAAIFLLAVPLFIHMAISENK